MLSAELAAKYLAARVPRQSLFFFLNFTSNITLKNKGLERRPKQADFGLNKTVTHRLALGTA